MIKNDESKQTETDLPDHCRRGAGRRAGGLRPVGDCRKAKRQRSDADQRERQRSSRERCERRGNIVTAGTGAAEKSQAPAGAARLEVRFGDSGEPFVLQMEDNATAAAIAGYVGTSDWRLPIYHYDDYENWEVMQYYDIPSRYEIPSGAVSVTSEKAGEVYYSEPNRIILFYGDADISGEYTKIGSIQDSEEFRSAVENNPVLEGWSNKIVRINSMD